jgi:hypothetical protein
MLKARLPIGVQNSARCWLSWCGRGHINAAGFSLSHNPDENYFNFNFNFNL